MLIIEERKRAVFENGFLNQLWNYFKTNDAETWGRACLALSTWEKPGRFLEFADFIKVIAEQSQSVDNSRKRQERARWKDERGAAARPFIETMRELAKKFPKNEFYKRMLEEMTARESGNEKDIKRIRAERTLRERKGKV